MGFFFRNSPRWIAPLTLIVTILVALNLAKLALNHFGELKAHKDEIDVITGITSTLILVLGAVFSYFRFFKGRTFARRLELDVHVRISDTRQDELIHGISLDIKNVGSVPIWEPEITMVIHKYGPGHYQKEEITDWYTPLEGLKPTDNIAVIDSGEGAQFFAIRSMPKEV